MVRGLSPMLCPTVCDTSIQHMHIHMHEQLGTVNCRQQRQESVMSQTRKLASVNQTRMRVQEAHCHHSTDHHSKQHEKAPQHIDAAWSVYLPELATVLQTPVQ